MDITHISRCPGEKGNLVDGCIKRDSVRIVIDIACQCCAVSRKTIHERGGNDVNIVREAIVESIPYHLHAMLVGSFKHWGQGGKVKHAGSFNKRPACPVTDCANIKTSQQFIIAGRLTVVLCELQHIQTLSGLIYMTGRLKARQEKGIE